MSILAFEKITVDNNPEVKTLEKTQWFKDLISDYEQRLLRYAINLIGDSIAADEVVGDTLYKAWQVGPEKTQDHKMHWLFFVCRSLAIDYLSKNKSRQNNTNSKMTNHLSPLHREVVQLKFQEKLSNQEISAITGHPVAHVATLVHESILEIKNQGRGDF